MNNFDNLLVLEDYHYFTGLTKELKGLLTYKIFVEKKSSIVFLTSSLYEANEYYQIISNFTKDVLLFPMDDFLTSEAIAVSPELKITRLETMFKIDNEPKIIITNLMGYLRETIVNKTGEMAIRGFVIDVFPLGYENPIRIEFWGDEIDSIKEFNIDSQLTLKELNNVKIYPCTEFIVENTQCFQNDKQRDLIKYYFPGNLLSFSGNNSILIVDEENNLLTK